VKSAQANAAAIKNAAIPPARPAPRLERKAPSKPPPPELVIEISSDSDQSNTQSESSASSVRSRKKVINTLTSVLSARSKAACGITDKPREVIEDIDKLDANNELAVVDYIEDIYTFYRTAQVTASELLTCFACLDLRDSFSKFDVNKFVRLTEIYLA